MKVIVLAAGKGSRLKIGGKSKFAFSIPFLLLTNESNFLPYDEFLVENLFKNLRDFDFETIFVLGYKFLEATPLLSLLSHKYGKRIDYVINPFYEETNTAYSLWLALKSLINNNYLDDVLIFNGDNYLSRKAWKKIKEKLITSNKSFLVIDKGKKLDEESFKIIIKNDEIVDMGKNLEIEKSTGEFIGVSFLKKEDVKKFTEILESLINKNKKSYYDLAFIELSKNKKLDFLYLNGEKWTEIDFKEDLKKLQEIIEEEMKENKKLNIIK